MAYFPSGSALLRHGLHNHYYPILALCNITLPLRSALPLPPFPYCHQFTISPLAPPPPTRNRPISHELPTPRPSYSTHATQSQRASRNTAEQTAMNDSGSVRPPRGRHRLSRGGLGFPASRRSGATTLYTTPRRLPSASHQKRQGHKEGVQARRPRPEVGVGAGGGKENRVQAEGRDAGCGWREVEEGAGGGKGGGEKAGGNLEKERGGGGRDTQHLEPNTRKRNVVSL